MNRQTIFNLIGKVSYWLAVVSILVSVIGSAIGSSLYRQRLEQCVHGYNFLNETLGIQFVDVKFIDFKAYCVTVYQGYAQITPISKLEEYREKWEETHPQVVP
jgi:multisubunit Na+/H+ antiporter MnhB subunit